MIDIYSIKAKGASDNYLSLVEHLEQVNIAVQKIGIYLKFNRDELFTLKLGAILHDIGKSSHKFQEMLYHRPQIDTFPFRHEIASILFLPLIDKSRWDVIIDMVIAHHRSILKDTREQGLLDIDSYYDNVFAQLTEGWEEWSPIAVKILSHFGMEEKVISISEAQEAYEYTLDYCISKSFTWSKYRGILMAADHFASALTHQTEEFISKAFKKPDISFYTDPTRISNLYPLSYINTNSIQKHTMLTAPTGAGKTDFLVKRCTGRIFYILPFQASINAMYKRFVDEIGDEKTDIRLLHSCSKIITKKDKYEEQAIQDKVGASIKVLTPFQILSIIFATKSYESTLIDLMGCDIILDEIHTYDGYSRSMVLKIIEVLNTFKCSIHVGTATMPSSLKYKIIDILGKDNTYEVALPDAELAKFDRHIIHKLSDFDSASNLIADAINTKKKILIVCNRVNDSQKLFEQISDDYPDIHKMLIHSKFKRKDRAELEFILKEKFNDSEEYVPCIVISTQVVEVSLDISFDLMITYAAPLDSLLQRFGRVNRKRTKDTIGKLKPIYVIAPPASEKEAKPYDLDVIQRSYEALPDGEVLHEKQVQEKIDEVYPEVEIKDMGSSIKFEDGDFQIKELAHNPKAEMIEMMEIDSVPLITESDRLAYENGDSEERLGYEISANIRQVFSHNFEQLKCGHRPFIVPDECYSSLIGLALSKEKTETNALII